MKKIICITIMLATVTLARASGGCSLEIVRTNDHLDLEDIQEIVSLKRFTLVENGKKPDYILDVELLDCHFAAPHEEGSRYNTGKKICHKLDSDKRLRIPLGKSINNEEHRSKIIFKLINSDSEIIMEGETTQRISPRAAFREFKDLLETMDECP